MTTTQQKLTKAEKALAHALNVSFLLRAQPGAVEARDGEEQYFLVVLEDEVRVGSWRVSSVKYAHWSPCFDSKGAALAAIEVVGEQEILKAMKAWQGVY